MSVVMILFGFLGAVYAVYYAITCTVGFLKKRKSIPESNNTHRIAAVIAARNEAKVIGELVSSLKQQDYPSELFDIFVVPNNCTDNTEEAALAAGAHILHCRTKVCTKGGVLRDAFDQLSAMNTYDTYCVFDADNVVDPKFMHYVNNARNAGYEIAQGFRDSKNPYDTWISGCTSAFYWFMGRFFNESRARLGLSAHLNGTGFMISDLVYRTIGWKTVTLTEDLEFTGLCALNGFKIGFMPEARVYDEQPLTFKQSAVQRRRWTAGSLQCTRKYSFKLMRKGTPASMDIGALFLGNLLIYIGVLSFPISILLLHSSLSDGLMSIQSFIATGIVSVVLNIVPQIIFAAILYAMEGRSLKKGLSGIILFPLYMFSWIFINVYAAFTKPPVWKIVAHTVAVPVSAVASERRRTDA